MKKIIHYLFLLLTSIAGLLFFMSFPRLFAFRETGSDHLGLKVTDFIKTLGATATQFFEPVKLESI